MWWSYKSTNLLTRDTLPDLYKEVIPNREAIASWLEETDIESFGRTR